MELLIPKGSSINNNFNFIINPPKKGDEEISPRTPFLKYPKRAFKLVKLCRKSKSKSGDIKIKKDKNDKQKGRPNFICLRKKITNKIRTNKRLTPE